MCSSDLAKDLAFGLEDTERLVAETAGDTPVAVTRALQARTEGWVAGIRLASLALRNGADPDELLRGLAASLTSITEFLLEEVLDHQPAGKREFLRAVAILSVLEPDICVAVTGRTDSAAVLQRVAADGLFVTPMEHSGDRYRFHPLLAELLRSEQLREDPEAARQQHRRAAGWLVAHDRGIEAIEHLLAAGDHTLAHEFVRDSFGALYVGAHRRDIDRWLEAMPDDVIEESLDRALDHCVALSLIASEEVTRWWLFCFEHAGPNDDWAHSRLQCVLAMHHAVNGRLPELRACWQMGRERRPVGRTDPLDEILALWEVRLETCLGDVNVSVDLARTLVASRRQLLPDVSAMSVLAGAFEAADRCDDAVAVADRAIEQWRVSGEPELPGMLDAFIVKASAARRSGDLQLADEFVDVALQLPPQRQVPHLLTSIALIERARVDHARGGNGWRSDLVVLAEELRMGNAPADLVDWVEQARTDLVERGRQRPQNVRVDAGGNTARTVGGADDLTDRELVILRLLEGHLTLPEIGEDLHISRHTVKSHVRRIYAKLDSSSRSEAVRRAREIGALTDPWTADIVVGAD